MFGFLWKCLVSLFTADKVGVLVRIILLGAGRAVAKDLLDVESQKAAFQFVKELSRRTDLTGPQKAAEFNKKFSMWLAAGGKAVSKSIVNCMREWAVAALKTEVQK